jgi:hypothetical protein
MLDPPPTSCGFRNPMKRGLWLEEKEHLGMQHRLRLQMRRYSRISLSASGVKWH